MAALGRNAFRGVVVNDNDPPGEDASMLQQRSPVAESVNFTQIAFQTPEPKRQRLSDFGSFADVVAMNKLAHAMNIVQISDDINVAEDISQIDEDKSRPAPSSPTSSAPSSPLGTPPSSVHLRRPPEVGRATPRFGRSPSAGPRHRKGKGKCRLCKKWKDNYEFTGAECFNCISGFSSGEEFYFRSS